MKIARLAIITALSLSAAPAWAQPGNTADEASAPSQPAIESDPVARKHVRGCPVGTDCADAGPQAGLREFELEAFPKPGEGRSPWMKPSRTSGSRAPNARHASASSPTEVRPDLPWLARLSMPQFKVTWDPRVIKYLEFYKDDPRGRNIMGAWLRDQGKWRDMINAELTKAGLPTDLLYVCMIESSYDPLETSRAGAAGLWQFMRHGGRVYGLRIDRWIDERNDPERATAAVLQYWTDLYQRFGDWDLAMAAFNAGYAGVLRSIAKYNTNDFWQLVDYENALPWGSSIYVPKALAAAIVGHNRALFGYDEIKEAAPIQWDHVNVPRSVSLKTVARAAGVKLDAVKELNPQLRRGRTPPGTRNYVLRVPKGSGDLFRARFPRMRAEWDVYDEYLVKHGERFEDIATMHDISRGKLRDLNGVEHESEVGGGETLIVPRLSEAERRANHERAMDKLYAGGHPKGEPGDKLVVAVPDTGEAGKGKRRVFYRVVTGDSLWKVSRAFGVSVRELAAWNGLDADGGLYARMVLQVFVDRGFDAGEARVALLDDDRLEVVIRGSEGHIVAAEQRQGRERIVYRPNKRESYADIGKKYGMSDHDLARINRQPRNTVAGPGDEVVVYRVVDRTKSKRAAKQARAARKYKAKRKRARSRAAESKSTKKRKPGS